MKEVLGGLKSLISTEKLKELMILVSAFASAALALYALSETARTFFGPAKTVEGDSDKELLEDAKEHPVEVSSYAEAVDLD